MEGSDCVSILLFMDTNLLFKPTTNVYRRKSTSRLEHTTAKTPPELPESSKGSVEVTLSTGSEQSSSLPDKSTEHVHSATGKLFTPEFNSRHSLSEESEETSLGEEDMFENNTPTLTIGRSGDSQFLSELNGREHDVIDTQSSASELDEGHHIMSSSPSAEVVAQSFNFVNANEDHKLNGKSKGVSFSDEKIDVRTGDESFAHNMHMESTIDDAKMISQDDCIQQIKSISPSRKTEALAAFSSLQKIKKENSILLQQVNDLSSSLNEKDAMIEKLMKENEILTEMTGNNEDIGEESSVENPKDDIVHADMSTMSVVEQAHSNKWLQHLDMKARNKNDPDVEIGHLEQECYPAFTDPLVGVSRGRILRVGIICFGLSGRVFHAPFILGHPRYTFAAVYERGSNTHGQDWALRHNIKNIKTCRRVEDLVNREDLDLIVVCSPIALHFQHAQLALQAGKHVLVEKAFTTTSAEATELYRLANEKGLVIMPYQNRRYDSDFRTLRRCLPQMGQISEFHAYFNRFKSDVRSTWKDQDTKSGGNFLSLGSHMIDQALCLFGPPSAIWADMRAHRAGSLVDDAWEVHLYYEDITALRQRKENRRLRQFQHGPPPKRMPPKTPDGPNQGNSKADKTLSLQSKFPNRSPEKTSNIPASGPSLVPISDLASSSPFTTKISLSKLLIDDNEKSSEGKRSKCPVGTYVYRGGFRAILKGSLLCPDHALRYTVHGTNGSWRKEGMDPQEDFLMTGYVPKYPVTFSDPLSGRPQLSFHGYGVEEKNQWGVFTAADGSTRTTLPELGSYFMLYDDLYNTIVDGSAPAVTPREAIRVMRIIELAKLSSQYGEVLEYTEE